MNNTTRRDFTNSNDYTFQVGYCGLQNLLSFIGAYKSNSGVYGWNWNGKVIPTELAAEFEIKAESIKQLPISYEAIMEQLEKLTTELADILIKL